MTDQFNGLTAAESERLYILLEEMGEVQQMIGKTLRHGYESTHPDGGPTNRNRLESEIGDVMCAVVMMNEAGDISEEKLITHAEIKKEKIKPYLHHQD